ncbi:meteorin-like protein [Limulus polyphemus]|uniref:Meteorin-like protein n=1 Tax=Limulus polyphemus TaxID=6850 RepID=A0ABM1C610_LIMPO|nr:meteorin-like protein [Limulus polyphemus]XP_022238204.1 meteorin-like protein [Limulus polyphemus]
MTLVKNQSTRLPCLLYSWCSTRMRLSMASPCALWCGFLAASMIIFNNVILTVVNGASDDCDWLGSGLTQGERGVQAVYLRCAQGRIEWKYPRGALRVVLRHGTSGKEFRGCLRVSKNFKGIQIYVEGHRRLHLLYSKTDKKHPELLRCFNSYHGQVALYVEAVMVFNTIQKGLARFYYDLQPVSTEALWDDLDVCRPCSEEEMLRYYCTSDFVLQGKVSNLNHNKALQQSELTVQITRIYRDSHESRLFNSAQGNNKETVLRRPLKCATKTGVGEYVFFSRWTLEKMIVQCAPRLSDWRKVRRKALKERSNQCQLG